MHLEEVEEKIEELEDEIETLKSIVSLFVYHVGDFRRYLKMYKELKACYGSFIKSSTRVVIEFEDIVGNDVYIWNSLSKELNLTRATINKHIEEVRSKYGMKLEKKAAEKLKNKTDQLAHHMLNAVRAAIIKQIEAPTELT